MNESPGNPGQKFERSSQGLVPAQLDYETPRDRLGDEPQAGAIILAIIFIAGFVVSTSLILLTTVFLVAFYDGNERLFGFAKGHLIAAGVYGLFAMGAIVLLVQVMRTSGWRTIRRWERLGMLLGCALTLMLCGIWFFRS
jgi:hypothetical protein